MRLQCADRLSTLGALLARWDVFAALAEVAHELDYCRPVVDDSDALELRGCGHPVVERRLYQEELDAHQAAVEFLANGHNRHGPVLAR
ncbi:MAG: hypothetical protein MUF54_05430 [Polyangiaceae bacterium]|nr:hypothetical protein [Polyangiaceae bacterium]